MTTIQRLALAGDVVTSVVVVVGGARQGASTVGNTFSLVCIFATIIAIDTSIKQSTSSHGNLQKGGGNNGCGVFPAKH